MDKLVLKEVVIGYNHIPLAKGINLEVGSGKLISLIGENGTGKSTLMYSLLKIIPLLKGEIIYQDKSIQDYSQKSWSRIFAAVFSRVQQIPHIKVSELIQIGSENKDELELNNISALLEISELLNQYATQLSDGQLQKVMIARAILQDTPYVIFDEPTAHLDYKNKRIVFELLKKTVEVTGKTFIVITHEVLQALAMSDEIWMFQEKQLHVGTPEAIDLKLNIKQEILKNINYGK
ncbi:ATP-binding cassette domain-containing protein [Flavobacteriaceae bacterium Ap0902]|nr:ATP-binding cassette domain-containing protein [Flavobacteriaceae bacterium Ap0902]